MKKKFACLLAAFCTSALAATTPDATSGSRSTPAESAPPPVSKQRNQQRNETASAAAATPEPKYDSTSSTGAIPTPAKPERETVRPEGTMQSAAPAPVRVPSAPPPDIREAQTAPPVPNSTWMPGSYTWSDGQWRWNAGRWSSLPQEGATWVPGRYNTETQEWTGGYWRTSAEEPASPNPVTPPKSEVAE